MTQQKRSIFGMVAVFGVLGGIIAGYTARYRIEIGPSLPESRSARVSVENLLASVDEGAKISDAEFFYELTREVSKDYVEPIKDTSVLGSGAVRGMISSLADPESKYFDKEKWTLFQDRQKGRLEGIGVDLEFRFNQGELAKLRTSQRDVDQLLLIPDLYVSSVVQGSSADKAGLRPGDQIIAVNGSWVLSGSEIARLRQQAQKADTPEMTRIREKMAKMAEKNVTPARAETLLKEKTSGTVLVSYRRAGSDKEIKLERGAFTLKPMSPAEDGVVDLNLIDGIDKQLATLPPSRLDLRGETYGRSDQVVPILEILIGGGEYGRISRQGGSTQRPISGQGSEKDASQWTVMIDEFTSGAALIIARAMQARGAALEGSTSRKPLWVEQVPLPDGSGYTLVTGTFEVKGQ